MIYLDTSALLKRYIPAANSNTFEAYFVVHAPFSISRLGLVEIRCALARKRRSKQIFADREKAAMNEIRTDIQDGNLDALYLAIARSLDTHEFATADAILQRAAQSFGMKVACFGQ